MNTLTVTVVDRAAMDASWGRGLSTVITRTVEISDRCPVCGGPRGTPHKQRFCEDGEFYLVDCWTNPCGHVDKYPAVIAEGTR